VLLLALTAFGCGSSGHRSSAEGSAGHPSSAQRCVDRWNKNVKRYPPRSAISDADLSSLTVHVGRVAGSCVVILSTHGEHIAFAATTPKPALNRSDFVIVPSRGQTFRPALLAPNAQMSADMKLKLQQ
jgi:hypothetical protein